MLSYGATIQPWLTARKHIKSRILIWITAKNRSTGLPETIGFWNGPDHETITVNSQARLYYAAGDVLKVDPLVFETGISVKTWSIEFSGISPEVAQAVRGYDARFAPVEVHQVFFDPETETMLDIPVRRFKGQVGTIPIQNNGINAQSTIKMELLNIAVDLTRTSKLKKSFEAYQRRSSDEFFKYAALSGVTTVVWGQQAQASTNTSGTTTSGGTASAASQ